MQAAPVCQACGQGIYGAYITALDATWHPAHFCCAVCRLPLSDATFYRHEGHAYHEACYQQRIAPRCTCCGQPMLGAYLEDSWGSRFCREHLGQYPACVFCGRLVPPRHQAHAAAPTHGLRCPVCRSSAIEQIEPARPLFASLVQWVNRQGLLYGNLDLRIELRNRAQLAQIHAAHPPGGVLGTTLRTSYTQDGKLVRTEINGVAILRGLPAMLFQGVTVHELGHAWLGVQGIVDLPDWAEEGFCELLAYRFYTQAATTDSRFYAAAITRNPDPVYGIGFQRVQQAAQRAGSFSHLMGYLQTTRGWPSLAALS